jgi:hypothetical protein
MTRSLVHSKKRRTQSLNSKSRTKKSINKTLLNNKLKRIARKCGYDNVTIDQIYDSDNHGFEFKPFKFTAGHKSYVMKPRPCKLDAAILDLFNDINNVQKTDLKLPVYNISTCADGKYSVWDFIEGKLVSTLVSTHPSATTIINHFKGFKKITTRYPKRIENMSYLNVIASMIGLTDLHNDNVILSDDDMYYPIDLEVVNQDNNIVTGLYGFTKAGPLHDDNAVILNKLALKLIKKFNSKLNTIRNRILPISTVDLTRFVNNDGVSVENLIEKLNKYDYAAGVSEKLLKKYLLKCRQHRIIPYFTRLNNTIEIYDFETHAYTNISRPGRSRSRSRSAVSL